MRRGLGKGQAGGSAKAGSSSCAIWSMRPLPMRAPFTTLVNVSKSVCEYLDVMLGTDSDDPSQTSDQPRMAGKGVID